MGTVPEAAEGVGRDVEGEGEVEAAYSGDVDESGSCLDVSIKAAVERRSVWEWAKVRRCVVARVEGHRSALTNGQRRAEVRRIG